MDAEGASELRRLEQRIDAEAELHRTWRADDQRALDKSEASLTIRLEAMNQFRAQLQEERGSYITREFADEQIKRNHERHETVIARFEQVERAQSRLGGALFLAGFIVPLVTGIITGLAVYLLTRHGIPVQKP